MSTLPTILFVFALFTIIQSQGCWYGGNLYTCGAKVPSGQFCNACKMTYDCVFAIPTFRVVAIMPITARMRYSLIPPITLSNIHNINSNNRIDNIYSNNRIDNIKPNNRIYTSILIIGSIISILFSSHRRSLSGH
jgi:hypothetical protein